MSCLCGSPVCAGRLQSLLSSAATAHVRPTKGTAVGLGIIVSRCQGAVQVAQSSSAEPLGRF